MSSELSAQSLYTRYGTPFALQWCAGQAAAERPLDPAPQPGEGRPLIAFLNLIRNPLFQVLGPEEIAFLQQQAQEQREATLAPLKSAPVVLIVCDGQEVPAWLVELAEAWQLPLFTSPWQGSPLIRDLRHFLNLQLAPTQVLHGVLLEVLGTGVLLRGSSGIGKSELALELISRGHRLIADDAPVFSRTGPDTVNGKVPEALAGFLEVRGLGVLDIRAMFGESAIKSGKNLKLIIQLVALQEMPGDAMARLEGFYGEEEVLGLPIPTITLPVASGRNMAVLVEGAVRNFQLRASGYDSSAAFIALQEEMIKRGQACN